MDTSVVVSINSIQTVGFCYNSSLFSLPFILQVRYHSRKKLAEQRPRIKGQFVSQKLKSATTTEDAETD
jgi:hypothetical protein